MPAPIQSLSLLKAELPEYAEVLEPPGTKNGEVWLSVHTKKGRAWVVTDAFFHMPDHAPGIVGLFLRLTGTTAGLRIGSTFLWVGVRDRKAYRQWLLQELETEWAEAALEVGDEGERIVGQDPVGARDRFTPQLDSGRQTSKILGRAHVSPVRGGPSPRSGRAARSSG